MLKLKKVIVFLLANLIGFFSAPVCYAIGTLSGVIDLTDPNFDIESFRNQFFTGIMITWLACAAFSLGFFFIKKKMRLIFLWCPVVIPVIYGLTVLFSPYLL